MMLNEVSDSGYRAALGAAVLSTMEEAKFEEAEASGNERVFAREVAPRIRVLVYTSISVGSTGVRDNGKDAIRVCAVYDAKDGKTRGIGKAEKRVNRVGPVAKVIERVLERMREVWALAAGHHKCPHCGAPTFVSKKGNTVCCDLCFKDKPQSKPQNGQSGQWKPKAEDLNHGEPCKKCGAPTFTSKAGNQVCSDFCWTKPSEKEPEKIEVAAPEACSVEDAYAGLAGF